MGVYEGQIGRKLQMQVVKSNLMTYIKAQKFQHTKYICTGILWLLQHQQTCFYQIEHYATIFLNSLKQSSLRKHGYLSQHYFLFFRMLQKLLGINAFVVNNVKTIQKQQIRSQQYIIRFLKAYSFPNSLNVCCSPYFIQNLPLISRSSFDNVEVWQYDRVDQDTLLRLLCKLHAKGGGSVIIGEQVDHKKVAIKKGISVKKIEYVQKDVKFIVTQIYPSLTGILTIRCCPIFHQTPLSLYNTSYMDTMEVIRISLNLTGEKGENVDRIPYVTTKMKGQKQVYKLFSDEARLLRDEDIYLKMINYSKQKLKKNHFSCSHHKSECVGPLKVPYSGKNMVETFLRVRKGLSKYYGKDSQPCCNFQKKYNYHTLVICTKKIQVTKFTNLRGQNFEVIFPMQDLQNSVGQIEPSYPFVYLVCHQDRDLDMHVISNGKQIEVQRLKKIQHIQLTVPIQSVQLSKCLNLLEQTFGMQLKVGKDYEQEIIQKENCVKNAKIEFPNGAVRYRTSEFLQVWMKIFLWMHVNLKNPKFILHA